MAELGEANIGGRMVPAWILNGNASAIDFFESTDYPGCIYRKLSDGTVEWVNPPMAIGVEYRTTERYMGKPVYVRLVSFGALPNATQKILEHGIQNISAPFSIEGHITSSSRNAVGSSDIWWSFTPSKIISGTTTDMSTRNAYVKIKYTKTTD